MGSEPMMAGHGMMTGMLAINLGVKTAPCQEIQVRNLPLTGNSLYGRCMDELSGFHY